MSSHEDGLMIPVIDREIRHDESVGGRLGPACVRVTRHGLRPACVLFARVRKRNQHHGEVQPGSRTELYLPGWRLWPSIVRRRRAIRSVLLYAAPGWGWRQRRWRRSGGIERVRRSERCADAPDRHAALVG